MGIGGISMWQLLIVFLIVIMIFGTKKLRSVGKDLGGAVKGFKEAVDDKNEAIEQDEELSETEPAQAEAAQKETSDQNNA